MQKEDDFELNIQDKEIEEKIIALFQEIKEGIVLESNDILDDLNPLMSNLCDQDKNKVVQALNKHFRDYDFLKSGNYWLQEEIDPNKEEIDYISFYESDRENNNYESILDYLKVPEYRRQNQIPIEFFANLQLLIKLKIKSLLVFDLLDYNLDKKDLTQIEILKILLELFYCNQMFTDDEQKTFEQVIGSLLQKQIYEVQYYMENLEKDDPQNFRTFVQNFLQKLQLKCISETDSDLQTFLQANQRYRMLLMSFNKEIINLRSHLQQQISSLIQIPVEQCQFVQIISYISDIENNDQLNDMYLQTVFYYWKKYCIKYNLQNDLKIQEDSLSKLPNNERKLIFIERYLQKQKSKIQDTIYLFVIHRICYYMEKIDNILCSDQYEKVIKTMTKNMEVYQSKKQYPMYKILKDNSKFMEYWKIIQSLRFYKQEKVEQNNQTANLITNLLWIYNQNVSLFNILNKITQIKKQTFKEYAILIYEEIIQIKINCDTNLDTHILQKNFLRIIYAISPKEENNYLLLRNLHDHYGSLLRAPLILEANFFINSRLDQKSISFFAKIGRKFIVIHNVFPTQTLQNLAYDLVNYLMSNNKSMIQECLQSLKCIFAIKSLVLPEDLQPIQKLIENFSINALEHLIVINKSQNISLSSVKLSIYAIFCYFQKVGQSLFAKVEQYLQKIFKDKCYYFPFVFQCLRNKISIEKINKIVELQYSFCFYNEDSLLKLCQEVFQQDEQLYQEWLELQKPSQVMLSIEYLKIKKSQQFYPKKMDIPLEDFNISLSEYSEQEQKQVFSNWIQDMTDSQKFKQIIPLFFNIIKRGESPQDVLILANQTLQKDRKIADGIGCLNLKSLFQIFFNNANDELKFILMKFFSKEFPIPFLYQNPILDNLNSKTELLLLNSNLFYFFDQGYTIINLSLSQNQKKIGKTDLINKIFYQREKFETSDSCLMNSNTIDIMFDFEFNNSRNFIVADAHGQIIFEILLKILPFFQFWIVQMDSQQEIQENINQLRKILQQMDQQTKDQVEICFIVRNTVENELMIEQPFSQEIESKEVQIIYIQNLAANQIDKQFKISQIQDVSKFLFNLIFENQKKLQQSKQMLQNKNNQFLLILQKFNQQYSNNIQQITSHNNLIKKIEEALNQLVNEQDGFYSQNAFPIRRILWNIKKLRQQNYELCTKPQENKNDILRNRQQISELEEQIDKQSVSNLLKLFSEIFSLKHYYIIYLWIVDKIRQFNQKNLIDLQQRDYELNEQFKKLKQEKQKIKQKYLNDLEKQCEDPRNKEIKLEMSQVKQQMDNNATSISHKNVGIELFWRELISLRKFINYSLEFDPVETLSQLIRKGESLEFLDGDTLSINIEFLFELEKKITQNNQIKILVISILGPQSSGKSTILNKIFGCHFWASVGRCTKGIHLQILQVQNKQLFQNRFDQILILDTEGLQNPNQSDPEFDKKIALFVLSISDIIIINVKGEINQQFKNLVEMCIFTLGHLKNGLQMFKQLSWFFNQNDNYKNVEPFRQQIKDLAQNLNLEWDQNNQDQQEEQIDYADILDIKDNISGLGFASDQKDWGKNGWNQSVNNNTFSREAYKQGINMIKRFIQKLEEQTNSFDHFLKNVQRNWESIEKLPDLLEFSELIQHQQNLMMKKYFDDLWKMQNITQVADNLTQRTLKKIQNLKQIVFDTYKQILLEKENEIESTYTQIKNQIEERMNIFRNENKISKKIMQKYLKKLESMIQTVEIECKLKLQNIIENYEGEYQQKKGYVQIDNFIQVVLSDEFLKKKFQGNKEAIEQEFKKKWDQFIAETERSSENQYLKMVESQYKAIKFISNKYNLNTKNEQDYINYFREEIIKQNPNDQKNKEHEKIFQLFMKEFQEAEQFIFIINNNKKQNLAYIDIFQQTLQEKLSKSADQLLDMKQFYSQEIHYQVVAKLDVQEYLNNQFEKDFHLLLIQHDMQSNVGYFYFNFITILDRLQILYDKNSKEKLDDLINYPGIWQEKGISQCVQIQKAFQQLKKTLRFECKIEIDLVGSKFGQSFKDMYKGLKITQKVDQLWNNTQKFKQGLLEQYIIIDSKIEIKTSAASYNESFNYIKSPKVNPPPQFKTNFPKQFNQIMIQQQGWNRLYKELYDVIKQEIGYSKSKLEFSGSQLNQLINLGVREDDNIQSFNPYVIKSIMQKVQNNIKVKYNNEFAQYGLILTDVGERCIFYYSMLIIWRFLCYQRWNSKDIQQKHQNNYQNELIRCIAEINQDNEKKGCIKANELVNKITNFLKTQFLDRTKKEVLQKMSQQSMTNAELIAKLDKELLIEVNEKRFEDEQFKQNILSYTTDHKSYINKYTQDMLTKVQLNLLTEYSVQYRKELSKYFRSIQENAKIFYKYIEIQQKEVKTIKYFYSDADQKHNLFYENYLFKLLFQCLIGKIEDKIDIIDIQYQEIFQSSNYNPVNSKFVINLQLLNQQDQQVYNLKSFVESLIKQLDEILKKINKISIKQSEYELDVEFGKLKLQMNGCEYICPCCKRKCDQDNDNDNKHTHQCQNGHQIRGINGILIEKSPSLYTCEEILDECILRTLETNLKKTWKEVKMTHSTWNFKNQDDATRSKNKEKWKNVWNLGLGKLVCSYLEKQLKHQIIFKQKSEFENQASNIHYILILDDSGSMQGDKWNIAKNGALECIKQLETTDCSKVSVIIFNQESRVAEECQTPNFKEMNKKIQYMGGGTNFEHPFEQALKLVQKYTGFNKIQILFYTDGQAGYPKATIDQFCQLPQEIRQIINLRACSGEESTQSLELIISKFTNNMQSAQLSNSVQPMDIQKIWTEVVSQNIHSQLV